MRTSSRLQGFCAPEEFRDAVLEALGRTGFFLVKKEGKAPFGYSRVEDPASVTCQPPATTFFAVARLPECDPDWRELFETPARYGAAHLRYPEVAGDQLLTCSIGARANWLENGAFQWSEESYRILKPFTAAMRRRLLGPIYATSEVSGKARLCREMKYSAGALAWVEAGGTLRQVRDAPTRFVPEPLVSEVKPPIG